MTYSVYFTHHQDLLKDEVHGVSLWFLKKKSNQVRPRRTVANDPSYGV